MVKSRRPARGRPAPARPRASGKTADTYTHPDQTMAMRPEVGTQAQFRKKKPPVTYRYDSSLAPALDWDGQNPAREQGETAIRDIRDAATELARLHDVGKASPDVQAIVARVQAQVARGADTLQRLGRPFLNWAGKAEHLSFDVPTLPLFVHERLSTKAIVDTLVSHKTDKQADLFDLFGDPRHSVTDQLLRAYEHADQWVNRLILGDSLVVMNSLLHYEKLGGQVQMIYIDPPYGVKFGSNFQPFVRKRDVSHNDDKDLTREPEMVKAYRDTWELGLHSYLTYMRDRLLLARELLTPSGSVFVQISDENVHHLRELLDEVFGADNFVAMIAFAKTAGQADKNLASVADILVWYARDLDRLKYRQIFEAKAAGQRGASKYEYVDVNGVRRRMSPEERDGLTELPPGSRIFSVDPITSQEYRPDTTVSYDFEGKTFHPGPQAHWKTSVRGLDRLASVNRLLPQGSKLRYVRYLDDFPVFPLTNLWPDIGGVQSRSDPKVYVVQTSGTAIQRCLLMSTDPGDLVLDPTCGSGTTAYVAEQWGRRWITIDTSRVPLALARQRLLTATFPYYELKEPAHGPGGGFVYTRKQNSKGEEVGGIVPHVTLKSIANDEPPDEEVLVDRPEQDNKVVRITGPFVVEATIPTSVDWEGDGVEDSGSDDAASYGSFVERMIEVLRRSPILHLGGGKTVEVSNIRPPARSLSLSAEGIAFQTERKSRDLATEPKPVAFVFGPENGAISETLVHEALKEADLKHYTHLYVIGFSIQPHARQLIDNAAAIGLVPAAYVQATPDLMMGDLLKNMRSSQIFSVCGLPEIAIHKAKPASTGAPGRFEVELVGLDTFDPTTMDTDHRSGDDVPCWMLDSDYNSLCFRATQVFFPRTEAWEALRKALKSDYDDAVWDHLAGARSAPFEAGEHRRVAVKVIDDRGNELLVVRELP
jgi:adenine-specific DNA-methyltransferase